MGISVIIPNYNGRNFLEECIPSVIAAMAADGFEYEVIVVDDASTDDSVLYIEQNHPGVRLVKRPRNGGFSKAINEGAGVAEYGLLLLLNNDIKVSSGFVAPLLPFFKDKDTFAVSNRAVDFDGGGMTRASSVELKFGNIRQVPRKNFQDASLAFGASGGHALYDKNKFIELGCFDELYSPFYWEDADICYRAYKRGYKSIYEPGSTVSHRNQGTIGKKNRYYVDYISARNYFIFMWKNLTDHVLLFQHIFFLPLYILYRMITIL